MQSLKKIPCCKQSVTNGFLKHKIAQIIYIKPWQRSYLMFPHFWIRALMSFRSWESSKGFALSPLVPTSAANWEPPCREDCFPGLGGGGGGNFLPPLGDKLFSGRNGGALGATALHPWPLAMLIWSVGGAELTLCLAPPSALSLVSSLPSVLWLRYLEIRDWRRPVPSASGFSGSVHEYKQKMHTHVHTHTCAHAWAHTHTQSMFTKKITHMWSFKHIRNCWLKKLNIIPITDDIKDLNNKHDILNDCFYGQDCEDESETVTFWQVQWILGLLSMFRIDM